MALTGGATNVLQWEGTKGSKPAKASESQKTSRSPDWSLQLDSMKLESLVIADQQCRGEYVPGPCTHRPSRHGSWYRPKRLARVSTAIPMTGVKS